jgi:hypothetical protein
MLAMALAMLNRYDTGVMSTTVFSLMEYVEM